MSEFRLIREYFSDIGADRVDVALGVGDDCALLQVPAGNRLAVSIDTLVSGVHFSPETDPQNLGHKALAVGLSDLAAMGAEPAWVTLALTLPVADPIWLRAFSAGFANLAVEQGISLVGGDMTRGPLSISVQVHGFIPLGQELRRRGAHPGDLVFVSGTLGDAGFALHHLQRNKPLPASLRLALERPDPRIDLGIALRGLASSVIDLSDGLAGDLGHILEASGVAADLFLQDLPLSSEVADYVAATNDWSIPLTSGDDYELCFTLPPQRIADMGRMAKQVDCPLRVVGRIGYGKGLRCFLPNGRFWKLEQGGFDHFPG